MRSPDGWHTQGYQGTRSVFKTNPGERDNRKVLSDSAKIPDGRTSTVSGEQSDAERYAAVSERVQSREKRVR